MKCFAQALDLIDDAELIRAYEAHHAPGSVWPQVTARLRSLGITRMKIFRLGARLFMYAEADDAFDPSRYQAYAADPTCAQWDALMRKFQTPAPGASAGQWWAPMSLVFDLEGEAR